MMSKFEMTLLTVTVVGTLVAWPALQWDSFVRPTDGVAGMACSVRSSAVRDVRPSPGEERASLDQASGHRQPSRDSFFRLRARLGNAVDATPSRETVAFRRDIVRNVHGQ